MRNLTNYNSQFILSLIEQAHGNPYKCTANVQYAVEGNHMFPVLVIYQDNSIGWDMDDVVIFCERTEAIDYCSQITLDDFFTMVYYYDNIEFQEVINDLEYEDECEREEEAYRQAMLEEIEWYNHARMMGWE